MTPALLMIIGSSALVVGIILSVLNLVAQAKRMSKAFQGGSMDSFFSKTSSMVLRHLLFGGLASLGGMALVGGFIWFLVMKFVP